MLEMIFFILLSLVCFLVFASLFLSLFVGYDKLWISEFLLRMAIIVIFLIIIEIMGIGFHMMITPLKF